MGGAVKGRFPPCLRIAALVQAILLVAMATAVLARAGLVMHDWLQVSQGLIWVVVSVTAVSFVLNVITPSVRERAIGAPAALLMLTTSMLVAIHGPA